MYPYNVHRQDFGAHLGLFCEFWFCRRSGPPCFFGQLSLGPHKAAVVTCWSVQAEQAAVWRSHIHTVCADIYACARILSTWFAHAYARAHVWPVDRSSARPCPSFVVVFVASGACSWCSHHSCYHEPCLVYEPHRSRFHSLTLLPCASHLSLISSKATAHM